MPRLLRSRKAVKFFSPDADEVSLVIDNLNRSWSMKRHANGYWTVKPDMPDQALHNLAYHFVVREGAQVRNIADPLAQRLSLVGGHYRSFFVNSAYRHLNTNFRAPSLDEIVIYESHLPALSRHRSAEIKRDEYRGTYLGAASDFVLNHLQRLRVAVEFLPLHLSNAKLGQDWGYYSVAYSAMRPEYAVDEANINIEVMTMIDAMHGRGIPVILDVVFNHGAELWVKAWGRDVVYRRLPDGSSCQGSGCGPTVKTENKHIRKTIIETLQHLVTQYGFNGFRFDLGALHDKQTMIDIARHLPKRIYLIAEPWALGGTQWGKEAMSGEFARTRWAIWNDDFRKSGQVFIQGHGDHLNRDRLMRAIVGSHVRDGGWALRPQQSVNYLSCHDGRTLADLVGGDKCRVFLGVFLVLTSQGIPMLGEGSEMLYSKNGHDNSYDRPDLNQLDWHNAALHSDLVEAVVRLVALRKQLSHFRYRGHLKANDQRSDRWDIDWIHPTGYPHNDNVNAIAYIIRPPRRYVPLRRKSQALLILLNGSHSGVDFHLPQGEWKVLVDGLHLKVDPRGIGTVPNPKGHYHLHSGTCAMLAPIT